MSYSLYQKYRPQTFTDIFSQNHVVRTLSGAIKNDLIGHAYLLTGPRGTGKTSLARIFAKAVNCEKRKNKNPCLACKSCENIAAGKSLDIIEIDAASNTGVDNIRELRETVKLPPTLGRFKVYIIDEVHMLSGGAFNALLKTLEEPPAHVIFILATTEIHKIPETILSRCQRFDLTRLPFDQIIKKLSLIAEKEKINIDKSALEMIAISAEGGMRNAESLLNQIVSVGGKKIDSKQIEQILGIANRTIVSQIAKYILEKNATEALNEIHNLVNSGYDLEAFTKSLLGYFRQLLLLAVNENLSENFSYKLTSDQIEEMKTLAKSQPIGEIALAVGNLIEIQNEIKSSFIPQLPLELAIIKSISKFSQNIAPNQTAAGQKQMAINHKQQATTDTHQIEKKTEKPTTAVPNAQNINTDQLKDAPVPEPVKLNVDSDISLHQIKENWRKLVAEIKQNNFSLSGILLSSQPIKVDSNSLTIATTHSFAKDRINDANNQLTIQQSLANIMKVAIKIKAVTNEEAGIKTSLPAPSTPVSTPKQEEISDPIVKEALNIFGGKLVNE